MLHSKKIKEFPIRSTKDGENIIEFPKKCAQMKSKQNRIKKIMGFLFEAKKII